MYMKPVFYSLIILSVAAGCKSEKQKLSDQIQKNEKTLYTDTTKILNHNLALSEIDLYKEYAQKFPDDTISATYLFRAADLAHGLRKDREAMDLYSEFINKYPSHQKAAASLFLIAFIYDNDMNMKDSAKVKYREFLEKYPQHNLAPSAKAALDQIEMGLSDEELVKMFEAKQDSLKKANPN
jgi:TolA-binding protein